MEGFVKSINKNDTKKCWIQCQFQPCLEINLSGIGIARCPKCSICKVCSNLLHSIVWDNSNIALDFFQFSVSPPMTITPLPVGDVTIAGPSNFNGRFGPEI